MHLTPAILEAAYAYLRSTPPFSKWKLPEADAVEFRVIASQKVYGSHNYDADRPGYCRINISVTHCKSTQRLLETMAHEMTHVYQFETACKSRLPASHGPKFKRLALQVCRQHGFDPKTF